MDMTCIRTRIQHVTILTHSKKFATFCVDDHYFIVTLSLVLKPCSFHILTTWSFSMDFWLGSETVRRVSERDGKKKIVVFFICAGCRDPSGLGSVSGWKIWDPVYKWLEGKIFFSSVTHIRLSVNTGICEFVYDLANVWFKSLSGEVWKCGVGCSLLFEVVAGAK